MTSTSTTRDTNGRTPQEKIDALHRPQWCIATDKGQLYWDLVCAAIRDDAHTIRNHLRQHPNCARLEYWYTPPIHFAVQEGNLQATQALWEAYTPEGVTSLIQMAEDRSYTEIAQYLRDAIGMAAATSDLRLHEAVEASDSGEIARLLKEVEDIGTRRDPRGRTALHMAALAGDNTLVRVLLDGGVDVDASDHAGFRAADYALWNSGYWQRAKGGTQLLQTLLDHGATDNVSLTAARGDLEAVRAIVKENPTLVNEGGTLQKRPLSAAVEGGHRALVRLLLDQGADPTLAEGPCCPHGSALMTATVNDDLEIARWLLDAGADPNGTIDSSGTPTSRAESDAMRGLLYSYGGKSSPAWGFVQRGEFETVAAILRYTDDPFSQETSEFQTTPYTAVISGHARKTSNGESPAAHEAMLQMFLQRQHPMPKVLTECKSYLYHVPQMTRQLLEHGLNPDLPDWQRRTPLHDICANNRHVESAVQIAQLFLDYGADLEAVDEADRSTPLGLAAREGHIALVEALLERGANPHGAGASWATPLAWAERRGHRAIVTLLQSLGA